MSDCIKVFGQGERFHVIVTVKPKSAYPFEDFKSNIEDLEELIDANLEVKEVGDSYELSVDKVKWIESYEGRGCPMSDRRDLALAKIFADELMGEIYHSEGTEVVVKVVSTGTEVKVKD